MPNALALSVVAALSVGGAALGLELGRSTIGEIDPAYFRDPEVSFHAGLAPNASRDWEQVQAQEYAQGEPAITQCIGCLAGPPPDYPVEYVPQHDPYVDTAVSRWPARDARGAEAPAEIVYVEVPAPERERIVRYASYPVTQEEAQAMAERDAPAADDDPAGESAATQ